MDKSTNINDLPFKKTVSQDLMNAGNVSANNTNPNGPPQGALNTMGNPPPKPMNTSPDLNQAQQQALGVNKPSNSFSKLPSGMNQATTKVLPSTIKGPGQGFSNATTGSKFEFFGLNECDYKSIIVVFALLMILTSNLFFSAIRNVLPAVMNEGKVTLVGSLIAAVLGTIIYTILKCCANIK